jgi:hypothetical protein
MVPAAESHGQHEVPPESEGQLWQLEREIGRSDGGSAGKLPRCRSSHRRVLTGSHLRSSLIKLYTL